MLTWVVRTTSNEESSLLGFSTFWQKCHLFGATENLFESKSFHLKPLLLLLNEKVITYMKTVIWQCRVCVYSTAASIFVGQLGFAVSFCLWAKASAHGFLAGTAGTWQCQRLGEVGTRETGVVLVTELFALCTTTWKSLLEELFSALWLFKIPCSLEWRMWVQEERKE